MFGALVLGAGHSFVCMKASAHWEVWGGQGGSPPEGLTQSLPRRDGLPQSPISSILLPSSCSLIVWKGLIKSMLQLPKPASSIAWCQVFMSEYQNIALGLQEYGTFFGSPEIFQS